MVKLLIADDHPLYRDALKGALNMNFSELEILEADDLNSTVSQIQKNELDLLLLDLHMPGSSDLFGFLHIQKQFPDLVHLSILWGNSAFEKKVGKFLIIVSSFLWYLFPISD